MAGTIDGSATYRERIALPRSAVLDVQLVDVSRQDVAATVLSSKRYVMTGVPMSFSLDYDDALIKEGLTYAVQARISVDGKLMFINDTVHRVLEDDADTSITMELKRVGANADVGLDNTAWRLTELSGKALSPNMEMVRPAGIEFTDDGRFGATGGCNTFSGTAEISGNSIKIPDNMAGTLMACPPPLDKLEKDFLKALGEVSGYVRNDNNLSLTNGAGVTVMRFVLAP